MYKSNNHFNSSIPCLWCDENNRNYRALKDYFDYKFNQHSRILVVRIDLSFQSNTLGQNDAGHARDCFQRFMNNIRMLEITDTLVGFAWALEYGVDKGFHYHCFFLFDGARSRQDIKLAHELGWYWVEAITYGTGSFYTSNDKVDKNKFEAEGTLGVGMIHRNDHHKRTNLLSIASYIVKDNGIPSAVIPEGIPRLRVFGRSATPRSRV